MKRFLWVALGLLALNAIAQNNLIGNGDFEQGNIGFSSELTFRTTTINDESQYGITTDPHLMHAGATSYGDHTSGNGLMMCVNGSDVGAKDFWSQTVSVSKNTSYRLSMWLRDWSPPYHYAGIRAYINDVELFNLTEVPSETSWEQTFTVWNSGEATQATIRLESYRPDVHNDFSIDDLEFVETMDGLVAYYPFDGDADDYSGNGNHGTEHGGVSYIDSPHGEAASFDGFDDYVDIEQLLHSDDDATISFYAKSGGGLNHYAVMVSQGHGGASPYDSGFAFQHGGGISDTYFIFGDNVGGADSWELLDFPVNLELDLGWHHYVMTKLGVEISVFFDGILCGVSQKGLYYGTYRFNIGRDYYNADYDHRSFNGGIDELRIYNRALSASEVVQLYTQEKQLANIIISGPTSVEEGSLTPYTCTAHFTDGSTADVSEFAVWDVEDPHPSGTYMQGNYLRASYVAEDYPIGIVAQYVHDNMTKSTDKAFDVTVQPALEVSIKATATYNEAESRYDVQLFTVASTPNEPITSYKWDIDGDGVKDDSTTSMPSFYLNPGETRLIGVEVTDSALDTATDWLFITKDKLPVNGETTVGVVHNISQSGTEYWSPDGTPFSFDASKVDDGLIIIVHGRNDAATNDWEKAMGDAIQSVLANNGIPVPNIALYDWSAMANTDRYTGKGNPTGTEIDDLIEVREYGIAHGDVVADWIKANIALGNINTNQNIHIIGHSAGGFVAGRCACLLGDTITQITMLDTPLPYEGIQKAYTPEGGLVEAYITEFGLTSLRSTGTQTYVVKVYDDTDLFADLRFAFLQIANTEHTQLQNR